MAFVMDASVTAAWILPDEAHPLADECERMLTVERALVPAIWWFEVLNLLIMSERRGRLDRSTTSKALGILITYPIVQDHAADGPMLLALARTYGLTAYDAAYLELAARTKSAIATLDRRLATAASKENITVLSSSSQ
jgi:predicted nucleic acid-binding protein